MAEANRQATAEVGAASFEVAIKWWWPTEFNVAIQSEDG